MYVVMNGGNLMKLTNETKIINSLFLIVDDIERCLSDEHLHTIISYDYNGKKVQRGKLMLHTRRGSYSARFEARDGKLTELEF